MSTQKKKIRPRLDGELNARLLNLKRSMLSIDVRIVTGHCGTGALVWDTTQLIAVGVADMRRKMGLFIPYWEHARLYVNLGINCIDDLSNISSIDIGSMSNFVGRSKSFKNEGSTIGLKRTKCVY